MSFFIVFLMLFCAFFACFSFNTVYSLMYLIILFCITGSLLVSSSMEFIGLLLIIIYVGAVAILFVFLIMLVKIQETKFSFSKKYSVMLIIFLFCCFLVDWYYHNPFILDEQSGMLADAMYNIDTLGQGLYNYYLIEILLAGLILLIALVGAVIMTYNFDSKKLQKESKQLNKNFNTLSFFKSK